MDFGLVSKPRDMANAREHAIRYKQLSIRWVLPQFCERRLRTMPNPTPSSAIRPATGNCMMQARFATILLAALGVASSAALAAEEKASQSGQHPAVVVGEPASISLAPE